MTEDQVTYEAGAAVPSPAPAGEGERCAGCGHLLNGPAECHYDNEDRTERWCSVDGCPCDTTRAPSPARQGVEEAWERIEETRDGHGVEVAVWRQSRPTWTDIRAVPIAVEDEIAHQFALEQYDILRARAERAEKDNARLRAALEITTARLERLDRQMGNHDLSTISVSQMAHIREEARRARLALAGESTGAGEGE